MTTLTVVTDIMYPRLPAALPAVEAADPRHVRREQPARDARPPRRPPLRPRGRHRLQRHLRQVQHRR